MAKTAANGSVDLRNNIPPKNACQLVQGFHRGQKHYLGKPRTKAPRGDNDPPEIVVVADFGTGTLRLGFAGEDAPAVEISPSVIIPGPFSIPSADYKSLEQVFFSTFMDLEPFANTLYNNNNKISMAELCILITEPILNPAASKERLCNLAFETLGACAFYVCTGASLGLYASAETSGIVLDFGYESTRCVAIYEGYVLPHAVLQTAIGGRHLTEYLEKLLIERGFTSDSGKDGKRKLSKVAELLKREYCKVALSNRLEDIKADIEVHTLSNGSTIAVGNEIYKCAEPLFDPSLLGFDDSLGVTEMLLTCVKNASGDPSIHINDMTKATCLIGNGSLFPNLDTRLRNEIDEWNSTKNPKIKYKNVSEARGQFSWVGGSILASLATFQSMWVSAVEYENSGQTIVHRKCF